MSGQKQVKKLPKDDKSKNVEVEQIDSENAKAKKKKLKEDLDKLIDEIDDVLEENSEEFVKSYIQKGGE